MCSQTGAAVCDVYTSMLKTRRPHEAALLGSEIGLWELHFSLCDLGFSRGAGAARRYFRAWLFAKFLRARSLLHVPADSRCPPGILALIGESSHRSQMRRH